MGSEQNDYSIKTKPVIPKYKFSKLYQQTGGQAVAIGASSTESVFELPARCMNFSRSTLNFTATYTAAAGRYHWLYADVVAPIRQIQLYTRGGVYLCNLDNADRFSSVALKAETNKADAKIIDKNPDATVSTSIESYGAVCGRTQYTNFAATLMAGGALTAFQGLDAALGAETVVTAATFAQTTNPDYAGVERGQNQYEPLYMRPSYAAGTATQLNYEIPLSLFKDSIMELDKDLYFNEVLLCKITWNDYGAWGITATGQYAPTGGTPVDIGAAIAVTNLSLYLALESNPLICTQLISAVQSGQFGIIIPFTYVFRSSFSAATVSQNVSIRLNRAYGKTLKRIYHVIYNNTQTGITRYDHQNTYTTASPNDGIKSYYTTLDNDRRQEFDISTTRNEDWLLIRNDLEGSLVDRASTYRYKWFVLDKFDDDHVEKKIDWIDSGIPLDYERKWDYIGTSGDGAGGNGTTAQHYTYAVVTRVLGINAEGIFIQ
jgi:hypothetical protein